METEKPKTSYQQKIDIIKKQVDEFKLPFDLEEIQREVHKELKFGEFNLVESCTANTELHHKYVVYLWKCKQLLGALKSMRGVLYNALYQYYKHDHPELLRTSQDKERAISADMTMVKLDSCIDQTENAVDYLYKVDKLFSERNYAISTASRILGGG